VTLADEGGYSMQVGGITRAMLENSNDNELGKYVELMFGKILRLKLSQDFEADF